MFKDRQGREHMKMHFHVDGPLNSGIVIVHMMKPLDKDEWEYLLLALDVKGWSSRLVPKSFVVLTFSRTFTYHS
jgi:import inner membrane translocase subunit TIM21